MDADHETDVSAALWRARYRQLERQNRDLVTSCEEFRDSVLNQRHQLEEPCLDNDQINAVLGLFDDTIGMALRLQGNPPKTTSQDSVKSKGSPSKAKKAADEISRRFGDHPSMHNIAYNATEIHLCIKGEISREDVRQIISIAGNNTLIVSRAGVF